MPNATAKELTAKINANDPGRLKNTINEKVNAPFPPCSDVILSRPADLAPANADIEIKAYFDEYFVFGSHELTLTAPGGETVTNCLKKGAGFPPHWCIAPSCVTLKGKRGSLGQELQRLFFGDLIWLFYFERMGIFKMLGALLDDFATKGKYPLPNSDLSALILEAMVRQTKTGLSSAVRDRDATYRRCLGWGSDVGRKLESRASINTAFNTYFHKFLQSALAYYRDRRLAEAINAATTQAKSTATRKAISDTLINLKDSTDSFKYGRNYVNTLSGIVWCIGGLTLLRDLRATLGVPAEYSRASQFIPGLYEVLVKGGASASSDGSHYTLHRECAQNGRDILLDLQVLNVTDDSAGGELDLWLDVIESKVEGYRTAYQGLTRVDLGTPGTPMIAQQA